MNAKPALLMLLALWAGQPARALETVDARGLAVSIEQISGTLRVDGVPFTVARATGREVGLLARRIEQRWRAEGSVLQRHEHAGWQVLARLANGRSELIQWRMEGESGQLLHSTLIPSRVAGRVSPAPFALPARCAWGRTVEGDAAPESFAQHTAHCRLDARAALPALARSLRTQGWNLHAEDAATLQLSHAGARARLVVTAAATRGESWILWLASRHPAAGSP